MGTRRERGAVAVEFALVSPLLFALLFGLVDYGLYFADVLSVRQATTDAAREATLSVGNISANWPYNSALRSSMKIATWSASCGVRDENSRFMNNSRNHQRAARCQGPRLR